MQVSCRISREPETPDTKYPLVDGRVCYGSKCESLAMSISFPVYPNNRTLLKTIVSSDSGQQQKWIGTHAAS